MSDMSPKKRSWKSRLVNNCVSAMQTLRDVTNQVLDESNDPEFVENLFDSDSNDLQTVLKKEKDLLSAPSSTNTMATTTTEDYDKKAFIPDNDVWETQRAKWLTPTLPQKTITKRKHKNKLTTLDDYNEEMYLAVYKNLVVRGRVLKDGLNMVDGFKAIYVGWEDDKMFERVRKGGVP